MLEKTFDLQQSILNHQLMSKIALEISGFRLNNEEVLTLIQQMGRLKAVADIDYTFNLIKTRAVHSVTDLRDLKMYIQMIDSLHRN